MRKFLSLLTMCLLTTAAWAATVTIDLAAQGYANQAEVTTVTQDGITLTFDKGTNNNTPKWYDTGSAVRLYGGGTLTVTAAENITSIVFTLASGGTDNLSADTGTYSNGTWSGSAASVVFTQGGTSGHVRIQKIEVTTGGSGEITVAAPTFSPVAGTYYAPVQVTLNCATAGASIYYTTDGSDPTAASTLYSAPFTVSATTTVKAIAALDGKTSSVATAEYVMGTATEVANIAAFLSQADGTMVKFTNPVNVLAQYTMSSGNVRLFVKDNSGYMLIFGKIGQKYNNGDVIPAGFIGKRTTYDGEAEFEASETSNFQAASSTSPIAAEEIQAADVESDMFGHYVYIAGATLGYTTNSSGAKYLATISDNSGEAAAYNSMGASISDWDATYNVTAVIGSHATDEGTVYQVWPVTLEKVGGETPVTDGVATIAEYKALADNATFTFTGSAVVTYVDSNDKRYMYIKDETGSAMIFGTGVANGFAQGDVLSTGWTGKKYLYNGLYEITNTANLTASGLTQTVTPVEFTTSDINTDNQNIYCVLRGVKIASVNGRSFTFEDGAAGYNTFNGSVTLPSDLDQTYDIEGVISVHTNAQFAPTRFLTEVSVPKVADIATLLEKTSGVTYEIESDITAIYQNYNYLYVKDNDTYMLVFGVLNETFENGDIISGAQASWADYHGAPQLIPTGSTFVKSGSGAAVQPEVNAIEDLGTDMIHYFVKINNVDLVNNTEDTRYATITDETGSIELFNRFTNNKVTLPEDGKYNVTGFVSVYEDKIQVYPTEFEQVGGYLTGDVDGSGIIDVDDVNAVINVILGTKTASSYEGDADVDGSKIVDVDDVNAIINIILNN